MICNDNFTPLNKDGTSIYTTAPRIHHLQWFEAGTIFIGYSKVVSSTGSYDVVGSSLGILKINRKGDGSAQFGTFFDLDDPVCNLPPTDEADAVSLHQKYLTRFVSEW